MEKRCLLCTEPLADLVVTGAEDPELCGTCESLPPDERKVLRDQATARIRREET
jgi:hypothetical protein